MNNQLDPEDFYCCYLLTSLNPLFANKTYIGFTNDPMRRIRQHNGEIEGGANKTSKKRPWLMVLVVHGFTSKNAALRFEWAWQNPKQSLLTRDAVAMLEGLGAQDHIRTKLHVLYAMLGVDPFVRFPLTVNFFTHQFSKYLEGCSKPPLHVRVQNAPPESLYLYCMPDRLKLRIMPETDPDLGSMCDLCNKKLPELNDPECAAECIYDGCAMRCHLVCLANRFLGNEQDQLVPTYSTCPVCNGMLTWGSVVVERQKRKKAMLKELNMTF